MRKIEELINIADEIIREDNPNCHLLYLSNYLFPTIISIKYPILYPEYELTIDEQIWTYEYIRDINNG